MSFFYNRGKGFCVESHMKSQEEQAEEGINIAKIDTAFVIEEKK